MYGFVFKLKKVNAVNKLVRNTAVSKVNQWVNFTKTGNFHFVHTIDRTIQCDRVEKSRELCTYIYNVWNMLELIVYGFHAEAIENMFLWLFEKLFRINAAVGNNISLWSYCIFITIESSLKRNNNDVRVFYRMPNSLNGGNRTLQLTARLLTVGTHIHNSLLLIR